MRVRVGHIRDSIPEAIGIGSGVLFEQVQRKHDIISGKLLTVRPLDILTQIKGNSFGIRRDLIAGSQPGFGAAIEAIEEEQSLIDHALSAIAGAGGKGIKIFGEITIRAGDNGQNRAFCTLIVGSAIAVAATSAEDESKKRQTRTEDRSSAHLLDG